MRGRDTAVHVAVAREKLVISSLQKGLRDRLAGRREEQDYCKAQDSSGSFHSAEY